MSTQRKPGLRHETMPEEAVVDFLRAHPEFFQAHEALLGALSLPHHAGSGAISLVERQVEILRDRNRKLERKLRDLVATARANDRLANKIHALSLTLLSVREFSDVVTTADEALRKDFGADRFTVVLFDTDLPAELEAAGFVRCVDRDDPAMEAFRTFLGGSSPRCGRIQKAQREFLFTGSDKPIASAALSPLGKRSAQGFLAVGSYDGRHFHPGMSTDFLARVGDLVAHAMASTSV